MPSNPKDPIRVAISSIKLPATDGSAWIANMRSSIECFSNDGKSKAGHSVVALAVQVDPSGDFAWVVTPTDVRTPEGEVLKRFDHQGTISQAWIAR